MWTVHACSQNAEGSILSKLLTGNPTGKRLGMEENIRLDHTHKNICQLEK